MSVTSIAHVRQVDWGCHYVPLAPLASLSVCRSPADVRPVRWPSPLRVKHSQRGRTGVCADGLCNAAIRCVLIELMPRLRVNPLIIWWYQDVTAVGVEDRYYRKWVKNPYVMYSMLQCDKAGAIVRTSPLPSLWQIQPGFELARAFSCPLPCFVQYQGLIVLCNNGCDLDRDAFESSSGFVVSLVRLDLLCLIFRQTPAQTRNPPVHQHQETP